MLTFDDIGVPNGGSLTVNCQYSAQGVTFNNVRAIDYAAVPAGFAHSGTVAVEQCFAVEFCSAPITASFTDRPAPREGMGRALVLPAAARSTCG